MKDRRLRRCAPLKIFAHLSMFLSFGVILACVTYGIFYLEIYYGSSSKSIANSKNNNYFNTAIFVNDFGLAIDRVISFLTLVDEQNAFEDRDHMESLRLTTLDDYNNFQYAFYDLKGQLIYESRGFDIAQNDDAAYSEDADNGMIYYYSIDLNHLNLFSNTVEASSFDIFNTRINDSSNISSNFMRDEWYYLTSQELAENVGYIYMYVPENLVPGDTFSYHSSALANYGDWQMISLIGGLAALFVFLICLIYTLLSAGWSKYDEKIKLYWFDKIYTEIAGIIIFSLEAALVFACILFISFVLDGQYIEDIMISILCVIGGYIVGMFGIYSLARRSKAHNIISQSLIYKFFHGIYRVIYQGMINNNLLRKYISVVLGLGVADLFLLYLLLSTYSFFGKLIIILIYGCEFVYIGRKLLAIQDIARGAEKIAGGNLDYKIDTKDIGTGVFLEFANNINNIGQGLNRAVDESIKSERMKADLITNVSHDIKTPLTSIINYVDLLKRQNINQEPIHEYIEILDSKSQRLKMLIEDLVEASRASSGNIVLERTVIDFYELVQQIAGSYVEKYEQRQLSLVMRQPDESYMIFADGRRLYRVLDNLFNNAFKYAMAGSRVYIDLYSESGVACFIMKNISQAPLNITAQELSQRFVRGDESRTTEGSGLGLSIAQSLVELHGGEFAIHLDGDLFKAIIKLQRVFPQVESEEDETFYEE